jgi:ElaB/YqjD/DUF883 family membrane-anchored ribosome-binding protein
MAMGSQAFDGSFDSGSGGTRSTADVETESIARRAIEETRHFAARAERLADGAIEALDRASGQARAAAATAADAYADVKGRARSVSAAVDPFVRENPYASVMLAVFAGMMLGLLLFGRPRRVVYVTPARD